MIALLVAAVAKITPAVAAKITAVGIASGVVMYKAVKPAAKRRRR